MARLVDISQQRRPVARVVGQAARAPVLRPGPVADIGPGIAALGGSITKGSEEIFRAIKIEEERVNTARAEEAYNTYLEKKIDLTLGEDGFTTVKGADAVSGTLLKDYSKKLEDSRRAIAGDLSNDEQRQKFGRRADVADLNYKEQILRHLAEQSSVYAQGVHEGTLITARQEAVIGKNTPPIVDAAQDRIKNSVDEQADRNNWSKEKRDATLFQEQSKVYEAVVVNLINSDPEEARKRFALYRKKIDGTRQPRIEAALKAGGLKRDSQVASDKILSDVDDGGPQDVFLKQSKEALGAANDITNPELRDATVARVTSAINVMATQRAASKAERGNAAWEIILNGGTFDSMPVEQLQALRETDPRAAVAMDSFIRQREKGTPPKTNWSRYYVLEQMAADNPQEFVGLDLREELYQMAPGQFSTLSSLQRVTTAALGVAEAKDDVAAAKTAKEQAKRITYATARAAAKDLLQAAGLDTTPKEDTKDAERLAQFYDRLFVELEDEQNLQKGKATEEQVRGITTRLLKMHEDNFFGADVLVFEAPVGELYEAIPLAERSNLEQAMSARGQSLSRENVVSTWKRLQRLNDAKAARAAKMIGL